jgi:hypothetical protein
LLEHLLEGTIPSFDHRRLAASTDLLYSDLCRQGNPSVRYARDVPLTAAGKSIHIPILAESVDGRRFAIALTAPLATDHPADRGLTDLESVFKLPLVLVNELLVRGNLPAMTTSVEQRIHSPTSS